MKLKLEPVRHYYPRFWKAEDYKGNGKFRYDLNCLVVPGSKNDQMLEAAILEEATKAFGAKAADKIASFRPVKQQFFYRDGKVVDLPWSQGMKVVCAHRNVDQGAPAVRDRDGKTPLVESDGRPYGGCWIVPVLSIYAISAQTPGIFASFSSVQFVKDGEAFSGARASDSDFEDLSLDDDLLS